MTSIPNSSSNRDIYRCLSVLLRMQGLFRCDDQEVFELLAFLQRTGQPSWLQPTPGPCVTIWSTVFWGSLFTFRFGPSSPGGKPVQLPPQIFCATLEECRDFIPQFAKGLIGESGEGRFFRLHGPPHRKLLLKKGRRESR